MSWLSKALGGVGHFVQGEGHALGSALNNPWIKGIGAAGLAATGLGIPLSAAIMGGAGVLGGAIRPGGGLKGALTEGAQGALTGGLAGGVGDLVGRGGSLYNMGGGSAGGGGFAPSSAASMNAAPAGSQIGGVPMGVGTLGGGSGAGGAFVSGANTIGGGGGGGLLDSLGGAAKGAAGWAAKNPNAVSGALQGVGSIGTMNSENALRNAQAQSTEAQTAEQRAATAERARRAQALLPLLQAFSGQGPYAQNQFQFSPNPYYKHG